jgi:oxygen-independent coproporphyrinogen-3 oxidase
MDLIGRQRVALVSEERPSKEQAIGEFLFLGLRLREGVALDEFAAVFGISFDAARPVAAPLLEDGLLETAGRRLRLTPAGLLQADTVCAALL